MKDIEKYNQEELDQILLDSIEKLGINSLVSEESLTKSFRSFMKELLEYNSHTNLTAISDEKEIYISHYGSSYVSFFCSMRKQQRQVQDCFRAAGQ